MIIHEMDNHKNHAIILLLKGEVFGIFLTSLAIPFKAYRQLSI